MIRSAFARSMAVGAALLLSACGRTWPEHWRGLRSQHCRTLSLMSGNESAVPLHYSGIRSFRTAHAGASLYVSIQDAELADRFARSSRHIVCAAAADDCDGRVVTFGDSIGIYMRLSRFAARAAAEIPLLIKSRDDVSLFLPVFTEGYDLDNQVRLASPVTGADIICSTAEARSLASRELRRLKSDHRRGVITNEEYAEYTDRLLQLLRSNAELCACRR